MDVVWPKDVKQKSRRSEKGKGSRRARTNERTTRARSVLAWTDGRTAHEALLSTSCPFTAAVAAAAAAMRPRSLYSAAAAAAVG